MFSYAPAILTEAMKTGDQYERFKLSIKFGFSILHCMLAQDIIGNTPIVPIAGETYEGLYVMPDGNCEVSMEADYIKRQVIDLITGQVKNRVLND